MTSLQKIIKNKKISTSLISLLLFQKEKTVHHFLSFLAKSFFITFNEFIINSLSFFCFCILQGHLFPNCGIFVVFISYNNFLAFG
jgi:hypothetical protein